MSLFPTRVFKLTGALAVVIWCAKGGALEETYARMDRAARALTGLKSDFQRVDHTAVLGEDDVESGTFLLKRYQSHDDRFRLSISQPEPREYAFDGRKLEIYLPRAETVDEYEVGKYKDLAEQFLLLGFGTTSKELVAHYTISLGGAETVGNEETVRLELIPKSPEMLMHLTKVELWISDKLGVPVQQKLYTPGGNYHLFTYSNVMINPHLADSAVKLNLPKGIKREHPLK
jgi:outer membrane lipoprotein-sorting protein